MSVTVSVGSGVGSVSVGGWVGGMTVGGWVGGVSVGGWVSGMSVGGIGGLNDRGGWVVTGVVDSGSGCYEQISVFLIPSQRS